MSAHDVQAGDQRARAAGEPAEPSRSAHKRRAILDAARAAFLRHGYSGTSMDEVAAVAAVSKQTVYKQFDDKLSLFTAVVTGHTGATYSLTQAMVAELHASDDIENDLRRFARHHIVDITRPPMMQLRRVIIAEAERFPELARTYWANGPERFHAALAEQLRTLSERGLLSLSDPLLAARHLNWLILSIPINHAMFHGSDAAISPSDLERYADEAVRVFLAAYRDAGGSGAP